MSAGRPLEPVGDGRPRWMTAAGANPRVRAAHRIRRTGRLVRRPPARSPDRGSELVLCSGIDGRPRSRLVSICRPDDGLTAWRRPDLEGIELLLVGPLGRPILGDPRHYRIPLPDPPSRQGVQRYRESGARHDLRCTLPADTAQQLLDFRHAREPHKSDRTDLPNSIPVKCPGITAVRGRIAAVPVVEDPDPPPVRRTPCPVGGLRTLPGRASLQEEEPPLPVQEHGRTSPRPQPRPPKPGNELWISRAASVQFARQPAGFRRGLRGPIRGWDGTSACRSCWRTWGRWVWSASSRFRGTGAQALDRGDLGPAARWCGNQGRRQQP